MFNKFFTLKLLLFWGLLDLLASVLLMIKYINGIDMMFLVNVNFVIMSFILIIGALKADFTNLLKNPVSNFFLLVLMISLFKILYFVMYNEVVEIYHIFTYFYTLIILLASYLFVSRFTVADYQNIYTHFYRFARYYLIIASVLIISYFFLYSFGYINYFGMGFDLHYAIPFFIKNGIGFLLVIFPLVLMTGKRAVLVNSVIQYFLYFIGKYKRNKMVLFIVLLLSVSVFYFFLMETLFLKRIVATFSVEFSDSRSVLVAFGGRFEELVGIYSYFEKHPMNFFLGAPPGDYYVTQYMNPGAEYELTKNFSHVGPFSFLFRYGIFAALFFYVYGIYLLIRYFNPLSSFYLVFVGIMSSSFFGANLFSDPLSWIFIFFYLRFKRLHLE